MSESPTVLQTGPGAEWHTELDAMILTAASRARGRFGTMLRSLPGVYPSVVLETVQRLAVSGRLPIDLARRTLESSRRPTIHRTSDAIASVLPLPHPLDYDWRFSKTTGDQLLSRCLDLTRRSSDVLLIGTPTVLESGLRHGAAGRLTLLDASDATLEALTSVSREARTLKWLLGTPAAQGFRASVVLGDPPWYPSEIEHFLFAAREYCEIGGIVLMALAPKGTRPCIESERAETARFASMQGLELLAIEEGILVYESPLFEQNALKAEGIRGAPLDWRRGDLAIFKKVEESAGSRPAARLRTPPWIEVPLGDCRIRVRQVRRSSRAGNARLQSVVPGDVLPSVSRRDHRRESIDVWTSGNRIFRCTDTRRLHQIISSLAKDVPPDRAIARVLERPLTAAERGVVESAADQVMSLAQIESREARRLSRRGAGGAKVSRFPQQHRAASPGISGAW